MEYRIEKHVPIPSKKRQKPCPYPFEKMAVGESILVPDMKRGTMYQAAYIWSKAHNQGWKFKAANEGTEGSRIWRIK